MSLNIDSSRALRSPNELALLVQAVLVASPNDKSTWIEWKNGLVLSDKSAQVAVARHILGMANRSPEGAVRHAGGFAYVVIGAEPGDCGGVAEIDPADLDSGLQPYLGSEGPRWSPQYVRLKGKSVLVITIDPPQQGNRIFTLQREFDKWRAGAVFVRRPGRTIQAEPGDIRMLENRYAVVERPITLHVRPVGADDSVVIRPISNLSTLLDAWENCVRRELISPPPSSGASNARGPVPSGPLAQAPQNVRIRNDVSDSLTEEDRRTDAEFNAEIAEYVRESREHYTKLALARLSEQDVSQLRLQLANASGRNYADVRVEVFIPAPAYVERSEPTSSVLLSAPKRPRARGVRKEKYLSDYGSWRYASFFDVNRDDNGSIITFEFGRIRAEERIPFYPALSVVGLGNVAENLAISWSVTTSSVDGIVRGGLVARIGEPIDAADLVPELLPGADR